MHNPTSTIRDPALRDLENPLSAGSPPLRCTFFPTIIRSILTIFYVYIDLSIVLVLPIEVS